MLIVVAVAVSVSVVTTILLIQKHGINAGSDSDFRGRISRNARSCAQLFVLVASGNLYVSEVCMLFLLNVFCKGFMSLKSWIDWCFWTNE
jgi:hypothetical protein